MHIGDLTTNSILNKLGETHITPTVSSSINSSIYSGQKFIQLNLILSKSNGITHQPDTANSIIILRRVQDSYVNVTQLLDILVKLGHFNNNQLTNYLSNEILNNSQYLATSSANGDTTKYNDLRSSKLSVLKGLWIPYDKAVNLAIKFDIYEFVKKLFLIDVHDFDDLPKLTSSPSTSQKRGLFDDDDIDGHEQADSIMGSPSKKQKLSKLNGDSNKDSPANENHELLQKINKQNINYPFTLPPVIISDKNLDLISLVKLKFSEVFKQDDNDGKISFEEIKSAFQPVLVEFSSPFESLATIDVPLDNEGKTALHFAATLGSLNLVSSFIKLGLCSPIRGSNSGESPLISLLQVTNSMERGTFQDILNEWLWPNLWLFDNNKKSFLHYLILQASKNYKNAKFYTVNILEWILSNDTYGNDSNSKNKRLFKFVSTVINTQDTVDDNTPLHLAAEHELKWFVNILIELGADVNIANKMGVKPIDFDIVNEVILEQRKKYSDDSNFTIVKDEVTPPINSEDDLNDYITELAHTSIQFLEKSKEFKALGDEDDQITSSQQISKESIINTPANNLLSNKIFQSIQDLLTNTNTEYESIINSKKQQIRDLNKELHDSTLITANNRFVNKKIMEKLSYLDTLKLQITNINDKYEVLKKESLQEDGSTNGDYEKDEADQSIKYDADEPFIIKSIYDKLLNNEEVKPEDVDEKQLPSSSVLQARIRAYKIINDNLSQELANLSNYTELTSKFKKVVSFCTGVDVNEVDELLDGLLEAVESQQ